MDNFFRITENAVHIDIKVIPGASKTCFAGVKDKRLRLRIAAAPEDGKANGELISFTAGALGCAKRDVVIAKGEKSRLKTITVPASCLLRLNEVLSQIGG